MMEIPQLLWDSDFDHPWDEAFFLILNMNFPRAHRLKPSPSSLPGKARLFLYNPPNPELCSKQNCWSAPWPNPASHSGSKGKDLPRAGLAHVHAAETGASCKSSAHPVFPGKRLAGPCHGSGPLTQGRGPQSASESRIPPRHPHPGPAEAAAENLPCENATPRWLQSCPRATGVGAQTQLTKQKSRWENLAT